MGQSVWQFLSNADFNNKSGDQNHFNKWSENKQVGTKIKVKFMNWYLKVLKQYANFSGRARRKEYWMFVLFNIFFCICAMILDNILGLTVGKLPYGVFYYLYALIVLIPGLAVAVRRLHDVGKSGWMILIALIPIIGAIWLFVLMATNGNPSENQYGLNPKEVTA